MTTKLAKPKVDRRQPVALKPGTAVNAILEVVLDRITKDPVVKIALASFCEGRRLKGEWQLHITGVELVPAPLEIQNGAATPD